MDNMLFPQDVRMSWPEGRTETGVSVEWSRNIPLPKQPAWLNFRRDRWPIVAAALYLLASSGISVRYELQSILAEQYHRKVRSSSIRRIFEHDLTERSLIFDAVVTGIRRHKLTLVRLNKEGKELCREFGWMVCESEWERLLKLHAGNRQPRHTGAVLTFAYQARLRGWNTEILPRLGSSNFIPDVLVEKDGQSIFVEVELGSHKLKKWWNMYLYQGFAAICAKTPVSRRTLIKECRWIKVPGMATDLETLFRDSQKPAIGPMWAEKWNSHPHRQASAG